MRFITDIRQQTITINGIVYSGEDILAMDISSSEKMISPDLLFFLKEWFNDSPFIAVQTSGSTGTPKEMKVEKERMLNSAQMTCSFLDLQKDDTALLCMNLKYIGAKMVVVRSLLTGMNLIEVEPSGCPLQNTYPTIFAAMTPMQVYNSLQNNEDKEKLKAIHHLIIGGGAVDANLTKELKDFPHAIWSTYGMTETLSHIALRRINGAEASDWYTPFNNVAISLSEHSTLTIHAPLVNAEVLETNDIAEINGKGQFRILGRADNIINSGGIKIQIEEVEALLNTCISSEFIISSASDPKFGEVVIILIADTKYSNEELLSICEASLPKYWVPKAFLRVEQLPYTETHKADRKQAKKIANELYSKLKSL